MSLRIPTLTARRRYAAQTHTTDLSLLLFLPPPNNPLTFSLLPPSPSRWLQDWESVFDTPRQANCSASSPSDFSMSVLPSVPKPGRRMGATGARAEQRRERAVEKRSLLTDMSMLIE